MALSYERPRRSFIGGGKGLNANGRAMIDRPGRFHLLCSTADSGGNTGQLRGNHNFLTGAGEVLPQGDPRRALSACMRNPQDREYFESRFPDNEGRNVDGHCIGNLELDMAMKKFGVFGGIKYLERKYGIEEGTVIPMSGNPTHLKTVREGEYKPLESESELDTMCGENLPRVKRVFLQPRVFICRPAVEALLGSDYIFFTFSDLYTSFLASAAVKGVPAVFAEARRRGAKFIYQLPLMEKKSETRGFTADEFVRQVLHYTGLSHLDGVITNDAPIPEEIKQHYWDKERVRPIVPQFLDEGIRAKAGKIHSDDLLSSEGLRDGLLRHDPPKLGRLIEQLDVRGGWLS